MILVGVVGGAIMFSMVAIRAARKYLSGAKTSESKNGLGYIAKLAVAAYERDGKLCPSATAPVPRDIAAVRGKKYASSPSDWAGTDQHAGWACLGFEMSAPQFYQYAYTSTGDAFTATAHGDMNGDGRLSTFEVRGRVVGNHVEVEPTVRETDPEE